MSASLLVDLGNTCQMGVSIAGNIQSGGPPAAMSGAVIGTGIWMGNADTFCNLFVVGQFSSGRTVVQVQCSDTDTSGTYTDPTSGLAAFPTSFSSGGLLWINSGLDLGLLGAVQSGQNVNSGFMTAAGFQRTGAFARANVISGWGAVTAGFISQLRTTASGGGWTYSPGSGSVNV